MIFHLVHRAFALFLVLILIWPACAADDYEPGPDSKPQPGVPKGEVLKFSFEQSKIFPGTYRDYWVYVPAPYTPDKPACLYVNQDGIQWQSPTVFDNLIHKKEMPVTIGVFVMHGRVRAANTNAALDRFNRSYEYDGLGDNYVRFLLEELLPDVEKKKTTDGRPIRLSTNANDRAIGGSSSGAICAFTAAWERPDAFTRVFSAIGTYVGLRGGNSNPTVIRKYEPKPIRIFLQDGENDLNIYAGDWWMANQMMERALTFAGYEVNHVWGDGGHNGKHGTAIFPDAMRWLWKDWPQPVKAGQSKNATLSAVLIPGENWQIAWQAPDSDLFCGNLATDLNGEVFLSTFRVKAASVSLSSRIGLDGRIATQQNYPSDFGQGAFGPDGRLYAASAGRILSYDTSGNTKPTAKVVSALDHAANRIVVGHNGNIYCSQSSQKARNIWMIRPNGEKKLAKYATPNISRIISAIALSPDQTLLYAAVEDEKWIWSYQIQADGSLSADQPYHRLHESDRFGTSSGGRSLAVDGEGRLYVATSSGIQICDQAGRVQCILPLPGGYVGDIRFGGEKFDTLFAACGNKILKRKLKVVGANAWAPPHQPAPPRL